MKRLIAALAVSVVMLAGCATVQPGGDVQVSGAATDSSVTAEKIAGEITVYTALEDDQISEYLPLYAAQYPDVTVNIVRDSTGIVTAKLLAEKDNPQADVVWGLAATSLLVADQQGMLEPYAPAGLDRIRPEFRDPADPPHWVGIDTWFSAFCANTVELESKGLPIPASWADLVKPEYKGLIAMPNPASSGTGFLSVSAILQMMGEEEGWAYLDKLHDNIAVYTHSGSKPCRMAGAGEVAVGVSFDYRAVQQRESGEPIEPVFPSEGSGWEIEANALVKKADMSPAARSFLDWAISDEMMRMYAANYPITAAATDVAIPDGYPADPIAQLVSNDFVKMAGERERILTEWSSRYDAKSEPQ